MLHFAQIVAPGLAHEMAHKAALTAAVVVLVMLVARVFGRRTAGWLTGLPIITAPALVWEAVEQGAQAAARVAVGGVAACTVAAAFCFCYDRMARKAGPAACLAVAAVGVGFSCAVAGIWLDEMLSASVAATLTCGGVLRCLSESAAPAAAPRTGFRRSGLIATIALAAVSGTLTTRGQVDPFLVGLLAGLPIVAAAVTVAEHAANGAPAARGFLRGYVAGVIGKMVFGVLFVWLITPAGLTWALLLSCIASAAVCVFGISAIEWRPPRPLQVAPSTSSPISPRTPDRT